MLRVGIAGIGFMGWIHWLAYQRVRTARVVAVCTRDRKKLAGDWRGIKGNFGPPGEKVDLSGIAAYATFDELLADKEVDMVDLCLPPHLHADATIEALRAGKHVLCEKPMALTAADCTRMVTAARKAKRQLMIAHVLPFFPEYAHAWKVVDSGKYGRLLGGWFRRVISDPLWLKDFYKPDRVGGPLIDLHVHDAHFIRLLFGMPTKLASQGRMRGDVVEYCQTQFQFRDPKLVVSATSGVIDQQGRPFTHAFEIHLERATLHYDFAALADGMELMPLKVFTPDGKVTRPKLGKGDPVLAFEAEIKEATASAAKNKPSPLLSGELARDAIILCQKQTESVKKGRAVNIRP